MKIVVMGGQGAVGSAFMELAQGKAEATSYDLKGDLKVGFKADVLHVCIPYSLRFVTDVKAVMHIYEPDVVIVHSTVPVGTTRQIGLNACHAPVRGQHNNLLEGLKTFSMPLGSVSNWGERRAFKHLVCLGILVDMWKSPEETELAKLLCLSRYLNDLAFYQNAERLCRAMGVDRSILPKWTETYNAGYEGLDKSKMRPDLDFPDGVVGGACVIPVSKILADQTKDELTLRNLDIFNQLAVA